MEAKKKARAGAPQRAIITRRNADLLFDFDIVASVDF